MPIYYIAPREKRQARGPFRLQSCQGEAALIAGVIGQAQNDFVAGGDDAYTAARAYFCSVDYRRHAELLGLPEGVYPAGVVAKKREQDD